MRHGRPVVAHYGSVATEVAVCFKYAGIVHRSELAALELDGPEQWLAHLLDQALGEHAPAPGWAAAVGGAWCARPSPGRALIVGPGGAIGGWRPLAQRSVVSGGHVTAHDVEGLRAFSLIGPRAARVLAAAGVGDAFEAGQTRPEMLGSATAVLVCEAHDRFLILVDAGAATVAAAALDAAGGPLGLARVGHDAYDRLVAAGRPRPRFTPV